MPGFESRKIREMGGRVKALLYSRVGLTRNANPDSGRGLALKRELKRAQAQIARQERQLERLQQRLSNERQIDTERKSPETKAPGAGTPVFFVVGQHKPGTGWLQKMLNSHPEILCSGEGKLFGRERRNEKLVDALVGNKVVQREGKPSSLYNAIAESEYLRLWIERSVWGRKDDLEEHVNNVTRLAIDYFLLGALSKAGKRKRLVGDKTPFFGSEDVREMATVYSEAKVIHIIRDGRDQAVSKMHAIWNKATDQGGVKELMPEDVAKRDAFFEDRHAFLGSGEGIFLERRLRNIARSWRDNVSSAVHYGHDLLGDNYTEVRYEDLLAGPEEEIKRLFGFLGADMNAEVAKRCVELNSFEARSGRKQGSEDYILGWGKYRKGIAGDWKNVFTERDKEIFKEEAGDLLIELGYEKDHDW
jgi:hypothetical protein